jgi:hypothetical protein
MDMAIQYSQHLEAQVLFDGNDEVGRTAHDLCFQALTDVSDPSRWRETGAPGNDGIGSHPGFLWI